MIGILTAFWAGAVFGVAIMAMANFMSDADAESILDLTNGHGDE